MKKKLLLLFLFLFIQTVSALQINDTIFFASETNFTIEVDSITLDQVIVTNRTIQFHNLTSVGSNFTNINSTFDARADFIGLNISLTIVNRNTSTDLFTSHQSNQNFNATFISGHTIFIQFGPTPSVAAQSCNDILNNLGFDMFDFITIFAMLSVFIIISIVAVTVFIINGNFSFSNVISEDLNLSVVKIAIIEIMLIIIIMLITLIVIGSLCSGL